jgi:hypothetical protein
MRKVDVDKGIDHVVGNICRLNNLMMKFIPTI